MPERKGHIIRNIIEEFGGSFSKRLNIDFTSLKPREIFKWLLAAVLYGAPIPEKIASRTFQIFEEKKIDSPEKILNTGWDGLVSLLDEGGYVRYDFKTATKLLEMSQNLQKKYSSNLQHIHAESKNRRDLEKRLQSLAKGIGYLTVNIFLRELRGLWGKADPLPSDLCVTAAHHLGLLSPNLKSREAILHRLKELWQRHRVPGYNFSDFEAALVSYGLMLRRRKIKNRSWRRE